MAVYFIQCKNMDGPIKIGHSSNFANRLLSLQGSNPYPLTVLKVFGNWGLAEEKYLHKKFQPHRMAFEWFAPHEDIFAFLEKHEMESIEDWRIDNPVQILVMVPPELRAAIDEARTETGKTLKSIANEAYTEWLHKNSPDILTAE